MKVIRGLEGVRLGRRICLAMGVFDGVHIGHQAIISHAVRLAAPHRGTPAVLTFDPHPDTMISPNGAPPLLTTTDEKLALIRSLGIRLVVVADFDRGLAETPAADFARHILAERLRASCLIVGEGWRFGARGHGTTDLLHQMAPDLGFHVVVVPPVTVNGGTVSSTRIRGLLFEGRVGRARDFLGRWYELSGPVVTGNRLGRQLGFPTANLDLPPGKLVPPDGIYACWAGVRKLRPAVASIGVRPTFESAGERKIEVHLLRCPQQGGAGGELPSASLTTGLPSPRRPRRIELLGRALRVQFVKRLREEQRFESQEALVEQIRVDCEEARRVLSRE